MKKFILLLILISGCSKSEDVLRIDILGKWNGYQLTINGDDVTLDDCSNDQEIKLNKTTFLEFLNSGVGTKYVYELTTSGHEKCELVQALPFKWTINESNEEYPYILTENNWIGITHCHINDNQVEECNTYPDYDHSFKIENHVLVLNSFNNRVEKYTKGGIADPGESHYAWIHPDSVYVDTHTTR